MTHEQQPNPSEPTITELLTRYYEAYGDNPSYTIEQQFTENGHDVAWLRFEGQVVYDITGRGREGAIYEGYTLECACKFTEGFGWRYDEELQQPVGLMGSEKCEKKDAVIERRLKELTQTYRQGLLDDTVKDSPDVIAAIMLDLIGRRKQNQFLEGSNGASFWGGYYYLQTLQKITGSEWKAIWNTVDKLSAEKKIRIEGMVVQEYREPYKTPVYGPCEAPEPVMYEERADKIWALVPKPDQDIELSKEAIENPANFNWLGRCVVGLAHTVELAEARLQEAIANPRISHERLYQQSFVEPGYKAGALAVVAYTALNSSQPEEWVVEAFLGDAVVPEVHTLKMNYPSDFGIDQADNANLNTKIEEWYPN